MLYEYSPSTNSWVKYCDLNRLTLTSFSADFLVEINPLDPSVPPISFSLDASINYKKYSRFFHRIRLPDQRALGVLILTTKASHIPDKIYALMKEITTSGALSVFPAETLQSDQFTLPSSPAAARDAREKTATSSSGSTNVSRETMAELSVGSMHVEWDEDSRSLIGLPESFEKKLGSRLCLPYKHLETVRVEGYRSAIPAVLVRLRERIIALGGVSELGILRVSSLASDIQRVLGEAVQGRVESEDVFLLATVFKRFYRDYPVKMFNGAVIKFISGIIEGNKGNGNKDRALELKEIGKRGRGGEGVFACKQTGVEYLNRVVGLINEPEKSIFKYLVEFCLEVEKHSEVNKMGKENLAIVISPNLFSLMKNMSKFEVVQLTNEVKKIFQHVLVYKDDICF